VRVTEIFHSIQGESTQAGRPCVFVRFTGCDLRCRWCDTTHAFQGGTERGIDEIVAEMERWPTRFACLTGGEPTLQRDLPALAARLVARGWDVSVETHGQRPLDALPAAVRRVADLKTPGSGEPHADFSVLRSLGPRDELKVVVADRADFDWAVARIREHGLERPAILFSPVWGRVEPRDLAAWILESGPDARLQLQIHKILWGADTRGV